MKRADADPEVRFAMRLCIALAVAALFAAAWWLSGVLMLLFGGVIFAVALHAGASRLPRVAPLSASWSLAAVVAIIVAVLALLIWLLGGRVATQLAMLRVTLPQAAATAGDWLHGSSIGQTLLDLYESAKGGVPWSRVAVFTTEANRGHRQRRRDGGPRPLPRGDTWLVLPRIPAIGPEGRGCCTEAFVAARWWRYIGSITAVPRTKIAARRSAAERLRHASPPTAVSLQSYARRSSPPKRSRRSKPAYAPCWHRSNFRQLTKLSGARRAS